MIALIVDDSKTDTYVLANILSKFFTEVVCVGTPAELTATLKTCLPDMIFMDVFIGSNHNGIHIIDDLRQLSNEISIVPMVITSSAASPETVTFALEHGASDFLSKPVTEEKVGEIIRKNLIGYVAIPEQKGIITTTMF
ncbi:response regulator (plasmid) [Halopseudomonas sp. SMJS2]|uniref:response regulator n=1 Tax=Halopseudomonas sp. SMJS2 TaxID=3041098 RepID=UPI0024532DA8|nr:response regulator [Halopseudomonas sp. SMJS2]WGK63558.1 response regulator [Halopseudomonas sp. SMJS2]